MAAMSDSWTVEVKTYSSGREGGAGGGGQLSVRLPKPCNCKQAKAAIAKRLGLKPQSLPLFGLFTGPLGRPNKVLESGEELVAPPGKAAWDLSFHRWSFEAEKEARLSRQDDVATHLLYCEARERYEGGELKPSREQAEELETYMDPDFPVERQSVDLLRSVPGYWTYIVHECTAKADIVSNQCTIPKGARIQCHLDNEKLAFVGVDEEMLMEWPWRVVRRWKMDQGATILFEVCIDELNAGILRWVSLESRQTNFLFHLASEICDRVKVDQDRREGPLPPANPALAGKVQDPLAEFVNRIFFGVAPKFSSLENGR